MNKKQRKDFEEFLANAWLVDSGAKFAGASVVQTKKQTTEGATFKLKDTKRGEFFVTISKTE